MINKQLIQIALDKHILNLAIRNDHVVIAYIDLNNESMASYSHHLLITTDITKQEFQEDNRSVIVEKLLSAIDLLNNPSLMDYEDLENYFFDCLGTNILEKGKTYQTILTVGCLKAYDEKEVDTIISDTAWPHAHIHNISEHKNDAANTSTAITIIFTPSDDLIESGFEEILTNALHANKYLLIDVAKYESVEWMG